MGIESLEEFLQQYGKDKLVEMLSKNKVIITEKINAHRVSILKDKLNNIEFYGKKKSAPIKTIDRVISDLYEPFMQYILSQKENIPHGTFNFYFVNHELDVPYTKKPQNNLLLTNATVFDDNLQLSLDEIANRIGVSSQPTIFNGKLLKRKHIKFIVDYLENGGNLPSMMNELFENACSLSESPSDIIEGYIFKINNKLYKLNDNRFVRKEYPKVNTAGYEMLVMELSDFMTNLDFTKINLEMRNKDLRYANFIFESFNMFIEEYGDSLESVLINPPAFLKTTGNISRRYITNEKTLSNLKDERYEYVLRIFLTIFSRPVVERGLLNNEFIKEHNKLCKHINNYLSSNGKLFDFNEFKKFRNK